MTHAFLSTGGVGVDLALIAVIIFTVWEAWRGYSRGAIRQGAHAAFMILAAFISYWATCGFVDRAMAELGSYNTAELLASPEITDAVPAFVLTVIENADATVLTYVLSTPLTILLAPFIFFVMFLVISLLAKIVCAVALTLLSIFLGGKNLRYVGMAIGAVQGFAVALVLIMPLAGIAGIVTDSVEETAIEESELVHVEEKGVISMARRLGGDALLKSFSTVEIDGKEYVLSEEAKGMLTLLLMGEDISEADFAALTADEKESLDGMLNIIYDSDYLTVLFSGALGLGGEITEELAGELDVEENYKGLITALGQVFSAGDADVFKTDLEALKSAYYILCDSGALSAIGEDSDALSEAMAKKDENGNTVVTRVTAILNKNDRTRPIVNELTKLSLKLLTEGDETVSDEVYENVKAGVAETLTIDKTAYETPEEYKAAITESLDTTLKENSIDLEPEVVADMADYIDENYEDLKDATDEQINEIILSYHDAYIKYLESKDAE